MDVIVIVKKVWSEGERKIYEVQERSAFILKVHLIRDARLYGHVNTRTVADRCKVTRKSRRFAGEESFIFESERRWLRMLRVVLTPFRKYSVCECTRDGLLSGKIQNFLDYSLFEAELRGLLVIYNSIKCGIMPTLLASREEDYKVNRFRLSVFIIARLKYEIYR